jgi:cation diffusion facilitator CzcD-associated flavoprotein CzcO
MSTQPGKRSASATSMSQELGFDPERLRAKYREERDKRLRPDGARQYVEPKGEFADFARDPWIDHAAERAPLTDRVEVAIIGGGFSGLLAGARLRQQGIESVRLIEKGGDFGGTWYWNRYPGLACDVESYVYLPMLEEVGTMPREKYSRGAEILEHCRAIARKFDLYRDVCFQTEVTEIRWDDQDALWTIRTNRGDSMRARFVCLANGFLQKPKLPGIPGLEAFEGHRFHTSRWDYAYTGGDAEGALTGLADKRVGIIGTGATAVQCIPHLGESAASLHVFQRTPSSIGIRANRPTDPDWWAGLEPGWQRERIDNFQTLTAGGHAERDLVDDGWTEVVRKILNLMLGQGGQGRSPAEMAEVAELADFMQMEQIRARVDALVEDPQTAESLKPWYRQFCKRPCFHDAYLQTFNRPNVTLVDTQGKGVERITSSGVVANGRHYELDCLIFATGFEVGTDYSSRAGYEIIGRNDQRLDEAWRNGVRTLHGLHIHGFPNCFMMSIAQSGFTVNFPYTFDLQAQQIAWVVERALSTGWTRLEATAEGEAAWVEEIVGRGSQTTEFSENCTPGYYNDEGQADARGRQGGFFVGGPTEFADRLAAWRDQGDLVGLNRS